MLKPARAVFDHALLKGYIATNPFTNVPRRRLSSSTAVREHREWISKEVTRVIEEGYKLEGRKHARGEYGLSIELLLRSGVRIGECSVRATRTSTTRSTSGTCRPNGRPTAGSTCRRRARRPGGSCSRPTCCKVAKRKLRLGAGDDDFVFATRNGTPPQRSNWRRRGWDLAVKNAGLTDAPSPHSARHALAAALAEQGLSSSDVATALGHSGARITEQVYIGVFDRDKRDQRVRAAMEGAERRRVAQTSWRARLMVRAPSRSIS